MSTNKPYHNLKNIDKQIFISKHKNKLIRQFKHDHLTYNTSTSNLFQDHLIKNTPSLKQQKQIIQSRFIIQHTTNHQSQKPGCKLLSVDNSNRFPNQSQQEMLSANNQRSVQEFRIDQDQQIDRKWKIKSGTIKPQSAVQVRRLKSSYQFCSGFNFNTNPNNLNTNTTQFKKQNQQKGQKEQEEDDHKLQEDIKELNQFFKEFKIKYHKNREIQEVQKRDQEEEEKQLKQKVKKDKQHMLKLKEMFSGNEVQNTVESKESLKSDKQLCQKLQLNQKPFKVVAQKKNVIQHDQEDQKEKEDTDQMYQQENFCKTFKIEIQQSTVDQIKDIEKQIFLIQSKKNNRHGLQKYIKRELKMKKHIRLHIFQSKIKKLTVKNMIDNLYVRDKLDKKTQMYLFNKKTKKRNIKRRPGILMKFNNDKDSKSQKQSSDESIDSSLDGDYVAKQVKMDGAVDEYAVKNSYAHDNIQNLQQFMDNIKQTCIEVDDQDYLDKYDFQIFDQKRFCFRLTQAEISFLIETKQNNDKCPQTMKKLNSILPKLQFFYVLKDAYIQKQLFFQGELRRFKKNEMIVVKDQYASEMFIILQGSVQIIDKKRFGDENVQIVVDSLYDGLNYGDPSLLKTKNKYLVHEKIQDNNQVYNEEYEEFKITGEYVKRRTGYDHVNVENLDDLYEFQKVQHTVQATENSILLFINRNDFHKTIIDNFQDLQEDQIKTLRQIQLFKTIDIQNLYSITHFLKDMKFNYGDLIVRRGQKLDGMYIVLQGSVKVTIEFIDFAYNQDISEFREKYRKNKQLNILKQKYEEEEEDREYLRQLQAVKEQQKDWSKSKLFIGDTKIKASKGNYYNNQIIIDTLEKHQSFCNRSLFQQQEFEKQKTIFPEFYREVLQCDPYLDCKKIDRQNGLKHKEQYDKGYYQYSQVNYIANDQNSRLIYFNNQYLKQIPEKFRSYILDYLIKMRCPDQISLKEILMQKSKELYQKRQIFQDFIVDQKIKQEKKHGMYRNQRENIMTKNLVNHEYTKKSQTEDMQD